MIDFQKAPFSKRLSAFMLDALIFLIVAVLFSILFSVITGYDKYSKKLNDIYNSVEEEYGISFSITEEEYNALDEEVKSRYDEANKKLSENVEAISSYRSVISISVLIISLSVLVSVTLVEFVMPLIFKNGMTPGKKVFGLAVVKTDFVRISTFQLFVRAFLGKYTLEIMIPILIIVMVYFGMLGSLGLLVLAAIAILQLVLLISTTKKQSLHDLLSDTAVVDYQSQNIFPDEESRAEYLTKDVSEKPVRPVEVE